MYPISVGRSAGFTFVELVVAVCILSLLLVVGTPLMSDWVTSNKVAGVSEFYAEGMRLARQTAIAHNSASRFVMTQNNTSGQMSWQVDICFATPSVHCTDSTGAWSTTTSAATGDPEGTGGFKSIFRSAHRLPDTKILQETFLPAGATNIYFTPLGWVDATITPRLSRLTLTPTPNYASVFRATALVVTLAGMTSKCDPNVAAADSRSCPP